MKYKALNSGYPNINFPDNVEFVDDNDFIRNETDRIPLFIGTQFGIYPSKFSDLNRLKGQKIAVIGKSLLSGVQTELKEYLLDNKKIEFLNKINTIELKK